MSFIEKIPLPQLSIQFGDIFQKLHNFQDDVFNDLLSEVALPFLALNDQKFPKIMSFFSEKPSIKSKLDDLFRIISLRSNFSNESDPIFALFEQDLSNVAKGLSPNNFNRHKLRQYISDFLPLLYFYHHQDYPLSVFLKCLSKKNQNSILTLAFTFPHLTLPLFENFLSSGSPNLLLLASLSPVFRTILLPQVPSKPEDIFPVVVHFFGDSAYMMLLKTLKNNFTNTLQFFPLQIPHDRFAYLCFARCCISNNLHNDESFRVFLNPLSIDIFIAIVFFFGDFPIELITEIISNELFVSHYLLNFLYYLTCYHYEKYQVISDLIQTTLQFPYPFEIHNSIIKSLQSFLSNSIVLLCFSNEFPQPRLNDHLFILSFLIQYFHPNDLLPLIFNSFRFVSVLSEDHYYSILRMKEKILASVFEIQINFQELSLSFIKENPQYSVLLFLFLLLLIPCKYPWQVLGQIPVKFRAYQCYHQPSCRAIFHCLLNLIEECTFLLVPKSSMFLEPSISIEMDSDMILSQISRQEIDKDLYLHWQHCGFLSGPTFYFLTIQSLSSSIQIDQLHQLFSFEISFFYHPEKTKLLIESVIEVISFCLTLKEDIRISVRHLFEHAKIILNDPLVFRPPLLEFLHYSQTFFGIPVLQKFKIIKINFIHPL